MADFNREWLSSGFVMSPAASTLGSLALDQATDQIEVLFQAPDALTITRLGYRLTTITGASPVYQISLQGVDTTGRADGTIKSSTNAAGTFTPTGSNSWNWVTLTSSYTCARGEVLAIVIKYSSGTVDGSNNASFASTHQLMGSHAAFPFANNVNNAVSARSSGSPVYGFGTAGQVYGWPIQSIASTATSANSTPDELGMLFNIPTTVLSTYRVVGARFMWFTPASATTYKVQLYSGTTVLQDILMDSDLEVTSAANAVLEVFFDEATLTTLSGGTDYRISLAPQENTTALRLTQVVYASAADLDSLPFKQTWYWTSRTDAGAWSDNTAARPGIDLLIEDWSLPAILKVHPGMVGGMRG